MKKVLILLLTVAMVFSIVAVAGAAEFTDADQIRNLNTEAVTVLNKLGIIGGFPDGTFQPDGTLTRAQAAKIISYMLLGAKEADALTAAEAKFSDVPTSHWACKYVNYCADKGIVAGIGNGKFGPDSKLTGFAFGKMLLVSAAGFDAEAEGLVGADWDVNVNKLLKEERLNMGVSVSGSDLTRQDACHLALNTLFYGEYTDPYSTLAYKTYKVSRQGGKVVPGNYYRPTTVYTSEFDDAYWDGVEITIDSSPFFYSANGALSGGKLYTACGNREVPTDSMQVYRNGSHATMSGVVNTIVKGSSEDFEKGRLENGVSCEGYYDAVKDFYVFVLLARRSATITDVVEPVKSDSGKIMEHGSVSLSNGTTCEADDFTSADVGLRVFTWGTTKDNSWNSDFGKVFKVARGKIVEGTLTAATESTVTVAGKTYEMPSRFTTTNGQAYLDLGGQLGDTVKVLVSEYNMAYDIWKD